MAEDAASINARVQYALDIPNSLPSTAKRERVHKESLLSLGYSGECCRKLGLAKTFLSTDLPSLWQGTPQYQAITKSFVN